MAFFRYWNFTTCIDCNNLDSLEQQITQLLEQEEGCHRLFQLPQLNCEPEQLRFNYPEEKLPSLWIVSLFKGANDWTVIKTFPEGLFCRRAFGVNRPRLSYLTMQLKYNAFYLEVHHDNPEFLLEVDVTGRTFLSGSPGAEAPDYFQLYEEQVDRLGLIEQFSLIDVPESMQAAMKINEDPEVLRKEAEAARLMKKTEPWDYEEFSLIEEACQGHTERIDHALAAIIDGSKYYWYFGNLAYKIYNEPEKLKADDIRLLYFQPPTSYKPPVMPKIEFLLDSPLSLEDEEEDDQPF